jgi:hypothetical protein
MTCENCQGVGTVERADGSTITCFSCNGSGEICDVCGEASDDFGLNVCDQCREEEAAP